MSFCALSSLEERLGYKFSKPVLLKQALAHPSLFPQNPISPFERLEFLGDRVLGLVVAQWLFERYPRESEGQLARRLSVLVGREVLVHVAQDWGLEHYLLFGADKDQERHQETILSDGCEAVIGACFLDGALPAAQLLIRRFWSRMLERQITPPVNIKSALQEWLQGMGKPPPTYQVLLSRGPDHDPKFEVQVCLEGYPSFQAVGFSKKDAQKKAAQKALSFLQGSS